MPLRRPLLPSLLACMLVGCDPAPPADMVALSTGDGWQFAIDRYEFPNQVGVAPEIYVNLDEAQQACRTAGKRLCTAAEWRRACEGAEGANRFGYGPRYQADRCHTGRTLPSGHTSMMDPDELVATSGAFPGCSTPEGVFDLVGNAEEWVLDSWRGVEGMLEGGAWYTHVRYSDCSGRYSRQPDYRLDPRRRVFSAGFRCCLSDQSPGPEQLQADTVQRLAESPSPEQGYDPEPEVAVRDGLFVDRYEYPNRKGQRPMAGVSWERASELCQQADKRLCEAHEWQLACTGGLAQSLPYGDRFIPSACAVEEDGPAVSGRFFACVSPVGAHDMVGGLWEWTATQLDLPGLKARDEELLREIRGGSWYVDPRKATCAAEVGYPAAPQDQRYPDVGFRCCRGGLTEVAERPQQGSLDCPEGLVAIGDFCIEAHEHPGAAGAVPEGNLDLAAARQACTGRGLHLCSEQEWLQACAGSSQRRWPYGNVYVPERCHDESRARETNEGAAAPAGSNEGCVTPEGIFDLSGNLWEWVARGDHQGVLVGGGWNVADGLGQCTARARAAASYRSPEVGARCCASAAELARQGSP